MKTTNCEGNQLRQTRLATVLLLAGLKIWLTAGPLIEVQAVEHRSCPRMRQPEKGGECLSMLQTQALTARARHGERDVPFLKSLGEAYDALPSRTQVVKTCRAGKEVQIAIHQLGPGTNKDLLIFIHGVLADHQIWRYVAGELGHDHDIWLVDLPGCGRSEAPHLSSVEPDGYSPTALAERVLQALEQGLADATQAKHVTLVGHSLGGTICLRMFSDPNLRQRYQKMLNRIDGLALLAPCDVAVHAEIPIFVDVINLEDWSTSVGDALGLVEGRVAKGTRRSYHVPECATAEQAQRLTRMLTQRPCRRATQAMLRQAVPWKAKEHRPDWPAIERLAANYTNIDRPCLIVWGEWDEILPESMGHKLKDEIPGARLTRITGCGHSLPTEKPLECAQIVRGFVQALRAGSFDSIAIVSRYPELLHSAESRDLQTTAESLPQRLLPRFP